MLPWKRVDVDKIEVKRSCGEGRGPRWGRGDLPVSAGWRERCESDKGAVNVGVVTVRGERAGREVDGDVGATHEGILDIVGHNIVRLYCINCVYTYSTL